MKSKKKKVKPWIVIYTAKNSKSFLQELFFDFFWFSTLNLKLWAQKIDFTMLCFKFITHTHTHTRAHTHTHTHRRWLARRRNCEVWVCVSERAGISISGEDYPVEGLPASVSTPLSLSLSLSLSLPPSLPRSLFLSLSLSLSLPSVSHPSTALKRS